MLDKPEKIAAIKANKSNSTSFWGATKSCKTAGRSRKHAYKQRVGTQVFAKIERKTSSGKGWQSQFPHVEIEPLSPLSSFLVVVLFTHLLHERFAKFST